MDLSDLDGAVQYFCSNSIAQSTQKTYKSALNRFSQFCSQHNVLSPFPVSESILCYFTSYLATQNLSPQTIKTYLAGIRHMQVSLGLPEPKEYSSLPRLRLVQAGIQRTHSQRTGAPRIRLPITPAVLKKMQDWWSPQANNPDIVMLWAASTLCFFGFFRAGEITVPSQAAYNQARHLSWGDVSADDLKNPSMLKVNLKYSKTDQLGKGVDIYVGRTGCPLCPVAAVLAYMAIRGNEQGPFFKFNNSQPLTKPKFIHHVRLALQNTGLPYNDFAGHSFRIGAATTASRAGMEDSQIRALGRWSSAAFLVYIRTSRERLAQVSTLLANS